MTTPRLLDSPCSPRDIHYEDQAHAELRSSAYWGLRQIECHVDGQRLKLVGKVSSYFLKQIAQALLMKRFSGTLQILNEIDVESTSDA